MRAWSLLVLLVLTGAAVAAPEHVPPNRDWTGSYDTEVLKKHFPKDGWITDAKAFEKLWKVWRADDKVPAIDFKKEFVWISLASGPNKPSVSGMLEDGILTITAPQTLIGGDGFGYSIATFSRKGVKKVNGKELPAK